MPFGDSNGAFYEDEFHRGVEEWNSFTGDSGMVVTPNQVRQNQQLEDIETKPATGMGIEVADRTTSSPLVTITDGDIDKAMGIATAFSGGGLATKWPKGYYDKVPLEQRLSRSSTEPSHPGYRWDVLDKDTGKVVRKDVMTATGARRSVDNMDNKYGGYKHRAEPRQIDEGSYTQGELDFIKSNKIDFNSE